MRLECDPTLFQDFVGPTREYLKSWWGSLGLEYGRIFWVEYIPEASYLVVDVYKVHPETGTFYVGQHGEAASERWLLEPQTQPPKIVLYEWQKAMLVRQGRQGA